MLKAFGFKNVTGSRRFVLNRLDEASIILVDLLLPPWHRNVGKRLVKSPKIYVRDSGLVHALLNLENREMLLGYPVAGLSWEGLAIESLLAAAPEGTDASFYRTSAGAEIDLVLVLPGDRLWAIEIKRGLAPKVDRGFYHACADLDPERRFAIDSGRKRFDLGEDIEAINLIDLAHALATEG